MGYRSGNDMTLTCAIPFIGPRIADVNEYVEIKEAVRQDIQKYADALDSRNTTVFVNTADVEEAGAVYLTLTGTSAECGDDGSVGRGNRVTGVIAPFRSASLEAAAGKNPISHVGKLYNVLSLVIGQDVIGEVPEVSECQVYILSQIGKPLDQPLVATATVKAKDSKLSEGAKAKVTAIIDRNLADMEGLRTRLLKMEVPTY